MKTVKVQARDGIMIVDAMQGVIIEQEPVTVRTTALVEERLKNRDLKLVGESVALDHDKDGLLGGSEPGEESTAHKGAVRKKAK